MTQVKCVKIRKIRKPVLLNRLRKTDTIRKQERILYKTHKLLKDKLFVKKTKKIPEAGRETKINENQQINTEIKKKINLKSKTAYMAL